MTPLFFIDDEGAVNPGGVDRSSRLADRVFGVWLAYSGNIKCGPPPYSESFELLLPGGDFSTPKGWGSPCGPGNVCRTVGVSIPKGARNPTSRLSVNGEDKGRGNFEGNGIHCGWIDASR